MEQVNGFFSVLIKEEACENEIKELYWRNNYHQDLTGGSCSTAVSNSTSETVNFPARIKVEDDATEIKKEINVISEQSDDTEFATEVKEKFNENNVDEILEFEDQLDISESKCKFQVPDDEGSCKTENGEMYGCAQCYVQTTHDISQMEDVKTKYELHSAEYSCKNGAFEIAPEHHVTENHDGNTKLYTGLDCSYQTACEYSLINHKEMQRGASVEYKLNKCLYKTKDNSQLMMQGENVKHDANAELYKCDYCTFETKYNCALIRHRRVKHDVNSAFFKCKHCTYETKDKSNLMKHEKTKHDANANLYKCSKCTYETKYKFNLIKHEKILHNAHAKLHTCNKCDYESKYIHHLNRHIKMKHGGSNKLYKCNKCTYESKYNHHLNAHIRVKHDVNTKLYKCNKCTYESKYNHHVNAHIKIQHDANTKLYKCNKCAYENKYKHHLTAHMRMKHDIDNES